MDPRTAAAITLTLALLALTLGYAGLCWVLPFRDCRRCHGTRTVPPLFGIGRPRTCTHCRHTGKQLRLGRRAWNHFHAIRSDAHRAERTGSPWTPGVGKAHR